MNKKWLVCLLAAHVFFACATPEPRVAAIFGHQLEFYPDVHDPSVLVYRNKFKKVTQYSRFMIDPVEIYSVQYAGPKALNPDQKKSLETAFQEILIASLKDYEVIDHPDQGVLRIRTRVRDIHPSHWELNEDRFIMVRFDTPIESAALEVEGLDAVNLEPVFALINPIDKKISIKQDNVERLETIRDIFHAWAKQLKVRLDKARQEQLKNPKDEVLPNGHNGHQSIPEQEGRQ